MKNRIEMTRKQKAEALEQLANLCHRVQVEIEREPHIPLNQKQRDALYNTLRHLDLTREYKIGYQLRQAFGTETDYEKGKDEI